MYKKKINSEIEKEGYKVFPISVDFKDVSICKVNVNGDRKTYCKIKNSPVYYYIIDGKGSFYIENEIEVEKDDIIEIPANIKYTYKGNMTLLEFIPIAFENLDFEENFIK